MTDKLTPDEQAKKREKEFDKHFKKIGDKIAAELDNHYETHVVPKHGDILDLHTKH